VDSFALNESSHFVTTKLQNARRTALFFCQWASGPVAPSATREYHPKVLDSLDMLQCIAVYFQLVLVWISGETKFRCLCGVKFHFLLVAHNRKPIGAC